jgi:toxin secretion/phage lysis holin
MKYVKLVLSVIGGFLAQYLGGWDVLLSTLVTLVILDIITGVIKGVINKNLSSSISFKGLMKKILIFFIIAMCVALEKIALLGDTPIREMAITFYIFNESLSIIENLGEYLPIPDKLKDILIKLKGDDPINKVIDKVGENNVKSID